MTRSNSGVQSVYAFTIYSDIHCLRMCKIFLLGGGGAPLASFPGPKFSSESTRRCSKDVLEAVFAVKEAGDGMQQPSSIV